MRAICLLLAQVIPSERAPITVAMTTSTIALNLYISSGCPRLREPRPSVGAEGEPRGSDGNDLNSHHGDPGRQFEKADGGRQQQERLGDRSPCRFDLDHACEPVHIRLAIESV